MRLLTRTMKETDDDESDGNGNELMTTMMSTKRMMRMKMMRMMRMKMMRMMRMMGMMRMMRMLRMRMRMMIMMSRTVVGLQYLLGPASQNPQCSNRLSPGFVNKRNTRFKKKKRPPNGSPNLQYAYERCSRPCNICMMMMMMVMMMMMIVKLS